MFPGLIHVPKIPCPPGAVNFCQAGAALAAIMLQVDPRQCVTAAAVAVWEGQELDFGSTSRIASEKGVGDEHEKKVWGKKGGMCKNKTKEIREKKTERRQKKKVKIAKRGKRKEKIEKREKKKGKKDRREKREKRKKRREKREERKERKEK